MVHLEPGELPFASSAGLSSPAISHAVQVAQRLVAAGAIVIEPEGTQHLVGYLEWLEAGKLFWFTAYGEGSSDGHLLEFDALHVIEGRGLYFSREGKIVTQLTAIDQAKVDDPDDYRIAWQLWQEVVPLRRRMIEALCTKLLRGVVGLEAPDVSPAARRAPPPERSTRR